MTEPQSRRSPTADAVEALVRSIEAKESRGRDADVEAPAEPTQPHEAAVERRAPPIVVEPSQPRVQVPPSVQVMPRAQAPRTAQVPARAQAPRTAQVPARAQVPRTPLVPPTAKAPPTPHVVTRPIADPPAAPIRHRPTATGWAWSPTSRGPLPGLVDRQLWEALVAEEAERQHRYERPAAVVLVELVGLEKMVERMGPAAMNRLVPPCAEMLVSLARSTDRITRLTNSRFGVLLLETDAGGGARFAARITVAGEQRMGGNPWSVRMVVGWAGAATGAELRQAIRAADAHLRARLG